MPMVSAPAASCAVPNSIAVARQTSITVQANWRIAFDFIDGDACVVNYEDCHR